MTQIPKWVVAFLGILIIGSAIGIFVGALYHPLAGSVVLLITIIAAIYATLTSMRYPRG